MYGNYVNRICFVTHSNEGRRTFKDFNEVLKLICECCKTIFVVVEVRRSSRLCKLKQCASSYSDKAILL